MSRWEGERERKRRIEGEKENRRSNLEGINKGDTVGKRKKEKYLKLDILEEKGDGL